MTRLNNLAATARSGRFLRDGLRVAIVGRPNAGKSSLLNQLLRFERAIVTELPGTTRDSLEELLDIGGVPVTLIDTAGVRSTEDRIEKIGIERTVAAIEQSDLVLFMIDLCELWAEPEEEIKRLIGARPYILIGNKADLVSGNMLDNRLETSCIASVVISALTGSGVTELTAALEQWVFAGCGGRQLEVSLNARQADLCVRAASALVSAGESIKRRLGQDCLATDLKEAINALSEICGEAVSEEIIGKIFAQFCIGK